MKIAPILVWLRRDLRTEDHPALWHAARVGAPVVPVFIAEVAEKTPHIAGGASRWWLHHSLHHLQKRLSALFPQSSQASSLPLVIRQGDAQTELRDLVKLTGAKTIFWNRRYEPAGVLQDKQIKKYFREQGLNAQSFVSELLFEPWEIATQAGKPYQVFTPFWKSCLQLPPPRDPYPVPKSLVPYPKKIKSLPLSELQLEPKINWAKDFPEMWQPGELGAKKKLQRFLSEAVDHYLTERDYPALSSTSCLSSHLCFGEISPFQIWHAVQQAYPLQQSNNFKQAQGFLRQIGWREFAYHLLFHFPHTTHQPLRPEFKKFPWAKNSKTKQSHLKAWQQGQTGYPLVDAGMRQLWQTGWMHNRVRMVVASFLVKDLLISWQEGARWFWDTLVDADLANNTLGWQWVAGCGADAAPFFRIFNPTTQAKKFDPEGNYIRHWVPELKNLTAPLIFEPSIYPAEKLNQYGVALDKDYPYPIVDHGEARGRALAALAKIKKV